MLNLIGAGKPAAAAAAAYANPSKDKTADLMAEAHANGDKTSSTEAGGGSSPVEEHSAASRGASVETKCIVEEVLNILDLRDETKTWLENKFTKQKSFEDFLKLSSEKIKNMQLSTAEIDGSKQGRDGEKHARFNQAERDELILLRRWMKKNRVAGGQGVKWDDFNRESFETFVREEVPEDILDEILSELKITNEMKFTLKGSGIHTPASFVGKSKYWYEHEIALDSADIHEIEKFKKWYKYQLDTYLPSDWIVSFRKDSTRVTEIKWRKVLKAIGLKADAIQALEINDVCDFATLNHTSKKWKISEPGSKKLRSDVSSSDSTEPNSSISNMEKWDEWQKMGLKESDARHIINFRHWHKFYVARKKVKSNWEEEFNSAQYERFVQRYIDPSKLDEFKKPDWWASRNDSLKLAQEKQDYHDILQAAAEDGHLTEQDRSRLRQHYQERREKMELIQEINEGLGDRSFQEKRLGEIIEEEAAFDNEKKKQDDLFFQICYRFFISTLLACCLLWSWGGTTFFFMIGPYILISPIDKEDWKPIDYKGNDTALFINNITFGLVTAVVVQELGEENVEKRLYYRFQPIYKEYSDRLEKKILREKNRTQSRLKLRKAWLMLRKIPLNFIRFSAQYYTYTWILIGFSTLVYGVCKDLQNDDQLYSVGQTWVGVAVTIAYSHFGLRDKNAPTNDNAKDAIDRGGNGANGGEEAKFTDERGETKVVRTRHDLMNEIDRYEGLQKKAEDERNFQDAAGYQKCYEQLEQLQQLLPTVEELESQVKEAEEEMRAAVDRQDYVTAGKFQQDVVKLNKKLEEEKDAVANEDVSSSYII